ncbi:DUF2207 domain-containing protein [Kribbella sp. NPDC026611]|uniref:DUF2207 domain-containing protein n=1 Tax=Kribbella sp. NPDC026611 TaxID=3154911 RepID=UPI0033C6BB79
MRRALGVVVSVVVVALALAGFAVPASAALGDRVQSLAIDYTVGPDGVLHVSETIQYRFGDDDAHGIFRDLVVREPFVDDSSKDQRYDVSNLRVSASNGASGKFSTTTTSANHRRNQTLRLKIGSSGKRVPSEVVTYKLSYDVRGALRHFADHSELYWDATGDRWEAPIDQVTISVTVPQGVQKVACFVGPAGSTARCDRAVLSAGKGVFTEDSIVVQGDGLTIVAGIKAGAVSNDTPILAPAPNFLERYGVTIPGAVVSLLLTVGAIVGGKLLLRRQRDQRYADTPPGTVPPSGVAVLDRLRSSQLPVAFTPPADVTPAEGGVLVDSKADSTEIAATLIDLAVRGAIRIESEDGVRTAVLVDAGLARAPHEEMLLKRLFPKLDRVKLVAPAVGDTRMANAGNSMGDALWQQVEERGWYLRMPRKPQLVESAGYGWVPFGCGLFVAVIAGLVSLVVYCIKTGAPSWLGPALAVAVPVLAVVNASIDLGLRGRRGTRSALGRAVTDQVLGFKKYLETAEADQLRFQDGEDIFSKYLPWAIVFGLADRWQQLCQTLVQSGRLPTATDWYSGPTSFYDSGWSAGTISTTVSATFSEPPTASTGGGTSSGFSSSSSSSSSSSGGGGGGGGGGSW